MKLLGNSGVNITLAAVVLSLCTLTYFGAAKAALVIDADAGPPPPANAGHRSPRIAMDATNRYRVQLDPNPAAALGAPNAADQAALAAGFPGWVFALGGAAPGTFTVQRYDVHIDNDLPFDFQVDYNPGLAGAPGPNLNWVQLVHTNAPCKPGLPNPYVDPQCIGNPPMPDDALPFYWTLNEIGAEALPGGGLRFTDQPTRNLQAGLDWEANLLLSSWNGVAAVGGAVAPTVTIYDGVRWGFEIACTGPGRGPNRSAGVAGDKPNSEMSGQVSGPGTCEIAEPGTALLIIGGLLALLGVGSMSRRRLLRLIP